ncbi:glycoside hydrolase family 3 protein [Streptomyces beijiangensis]|uniref:Glycoside hydrolase family 3 protein n=1 Tax=Streptomyces beijiangensis TaxID=163361 RepID=A0A939FDP7_9ACTN|nr:glycoside hydrolase family 3 protein [Streptomyces beijiangensis]MBO0516296.1 glycoside hydrolase family 3 protein [Streptomyces beijiangensis]
MPPASGPARAPELLALADRVLQPGFQGTTAPDWIRRRLSAGLGSVLLFGGNIRDREQTAALTGALRAENPDVLIAADEEGGDVTRLEAATGSSYPGNLALGTVDDPELTAAVAHSIGGELRAAGIGLDYAPDADVNSNPDNPVIGTRSFGADPDLAARHTAAWIRGMHDAGVAACAKHFPGHGDTDTDSHLALPTVTMDADRIAELALPPFRAALAAGVRAVMTAHLLIPAYDKEHPATASPRIITGLLREELGFEGLIVSDAVEMQAVRARYGLEGATVRALAAGVDLVCLGDRSGDAEFAQLRTAIVDAVMRGELPEERLAEAAARASGFAAWQRALAANVPAPEPDRALGPAAARRALRTTTADPEALPLRAPAVLVGFGVPGTVVQGDGVPWGLGAALTALMPGTLCTTVPPLTPYSPGRVREILADAAGRPLVLAVRDAHRHPAVREWLGALLAARPDAITVELGVPQPDSGAAGAARIDTHGAARVCAQAAAEVLAGRRLAP